MSTIFFTHESLVYLCNAFNCFRKGDVYEGKRQIEQLKCCDSTIASKIHEYFWECDNRFLAITSFLEPFEFLVHSWDLHRQGHDYSVALCRVGDLAEVHLVDKTSFNNIIARQVIVNEQYTPTSFINLIKASQVRIYKKNSFDEDQDMVIDFNCEYIGAVSSSIYNPKKQIDWYNWAVTLIDSGSSRSFPVPDFRTLFGHSVIIIEGMRNGKYFMHAADLRQSPTNSSKAEVRMFDSVNYKLKNANHELKQEEVKFPVGKTETFICTQNKVMKMVWDVTQDKENAIFFNDRGKDAFDLRVLERFIEDLEGSFRGEFSLFKNRRVEHNCISWAREKLAIAGIYLRKVETAIMETPKQYTTSDYPPAAM